MLKILWLSAICAIIGACPSLLALVLGRKEEEFVKNRIKIGITLSILAFVWMLVFLYVSCKPLTILTVVMWTWPILVINSIVILCKNEYYIVELLSAIILFAISIISCIAILFAPVQNLIYVHDAETVDITYSFSSDEILARLDVNILNQKTSSIADKYKVATPEMRKINRSDIAVYHIMNKANTGENLSEYIPGYIVMEKEQTPKVITKRIYFDHSYVNKKDALRTIRRKYPTVYIGNHKFDIDDNYNPYEIYEYRENLFFSNGKDYGIIIINLQDGTSAKYSSDKIPSWVDFKTTYPR
ncbi:MAG: hypothetical protein IKT41_00475 [Clostridia bacterium]|nr:hypothetical protein [Clostridia bacterium]